MEDEEISKSEQFVSEYENEIVLYKELSQVIANIVSETADKLGLKHFPTTFREKDVEKLREKISRKELQGKIYTSLSDIEDLAGARIIFYLESARNKFIPEIHAVFGEDNVRVETKEEANGYRATHMIITLDPQRFPTEATKFGARKCELQITSSLFHVWSEIEHDILYKPSFDKDKLQELGLDELSRSFEKVMREHIRSTSQQFDFIDKKYKDILALGQFFATDFVREIYESQDNDELWQLLEVLESYYHKKPDETYQVILALIEREPIEAKPLGNLGSHVVYGKAYKTVLLKAIELLQQIRYFKLEEVLELSSRLLLEEDLQVKAAAKKIVEEASKFNHNFLSRAKTYAPQRIIADFMQKWTAEEKLRNIEFIKTASHELLSAAVTGTSNPQLDTLVFHSGAIQPTDFIKQVRRDTIDLLVELLDLVESEQTKIEILKILESAARPPMHSPYEDDLIQMLAEDSAYLIKIFERILFDDKGVLKTGAVMAEEVETCLYWITRDGKFNVAEVNGLREKILSDEFYAIFRVLAGNESTWTSEDTWDVAQGKRAAMVDEILAKINAGNITEWIQIFNRIAGQSGLMSDWHFHNFSSFLETFSDKNPELAAIVAKAAIQEELPVLTKYLSPILTSLKSKNQTALWNEIVDGIISGKLTEATPAIGYSLNLRADADLQKLVHASDIDLLEEMLNKTGRFSYLPQGKLDNQLQHAIVFALTRIFKFDPKRIEEILIPLLQDPDINLQRALHEICFGITRGWLDISEISEKSTKTLKEILVNLQLLGWDTQGLMVNLGTKNPKIIFEIFLERIQRESEAKAEDVWESIADRYDAIPHDWHADLTNLLRADTELEEHIQPILDGVEPLWTVYNMNVGEFLRALGSSYEDTIRRFIDTGGDENLKRAVQLMNRFQGDKMELCIEIISKTDDERILSAVSSIIGATGVVSGEDGISLAYESKAAELEKYKTHDNERVKRFAEKEIKALLEQARRFRLRSEEERERRRLEFEESNPPEEAEDSHDS